MTIDILYEIRYRTTTNQNSFFLQIIYNFQNYFSRIQNNSPSKAMDIYKNQTLHALLVVLNHSPTRKKHCFDFH